ncbi:winged helix-turn-helix domain-containing protein [Streptomyces sp. YIM 121038]|uniref:winged helix-turn-helix domain-containing protein n=1 Tax=Streptomyces sp. YIM 121038 TaxID=2136401 RepID=UPI002017B69C|nr:winged helix-turn-helix domain-containing protein [Streptomyces sp. YIM 121038]
MREQVRFEAAALFARQVPPQAVAKRLRVSRKTAYVWCAAWRSGGVEALRSRGPSGRPSRMKPAWRAWLAQALEEGPAAHGWAGEQRWTTARVGVLVSRRFHVRFSDVQIWRILHQMGFTVQVHRAAGRDEKVVVTWGKETQSGVE